MNAIHIRQLMGSIDFLQRLVLIYNESKMFNIFGSSIHITNFIGQARQINKKNTFASAGTFKRKQKQKQFSKE